MHSYKHNFINFSLSFLKEITKRPVGIAATVFVILSLLLFFFFFPVISKKAEEPVLLTRVRIARDENNVRIVLNDKFRVEDIKTGETLLSDILPGGVVNVSKTSGGIALNGETFTSEGVTFIFASTGGVIVNDIPYRGTVDIVKNKKDLNVINIVDIEDYIKGVVPCEVNPLWPFAALKAQAIASRSFAAYQTTVRRNKDFDLTADTYSQVYKGRLRETARTNKAVNDTLGKVLAFKGEILPGYFHSCCGGHTEDAAKLWEHNLEPLKGVKCKWCRVSPHFKWRARINKKELAEKLNKEGYDFSRVTGLAEGARDASGRLEYVTVEDGRKKEGIDILKFRAIVGRSTLKSANFHIGGFFKPFSIKGFGWGHGVGMCQWGAFGLALRRRSAEKILEYYYPGAEIVDIKKVLPGSL